MRNANRMLTLAMVISIVMTLALTANAVIPLGKPAGIYGYVYGTSSQGNQAIETTTRVTTNPDGAKLTVTVVTYVDDINDHLTYDISSSAEGVVSYAYRSPLMYSDILPEKCYTSHKVSNGESNYANQYDREFDIDTDLLG